jgi:hypothetical protein
MSLTLSVPGRFRRENRWPIHLKRLIRSRIACFSFGLSMRTER